MTASPGTRRTAPRPGRVARLAARLPATSRATAASVLPGALAPPVEPGEYTPTIAIIGTGFGGIGMACRLRQAGIETFTIFDKADSVGGTWRDNTYPGAACDLPSHLYSLSFAPKTDWTRKFPQQPEILSYLDGVVDDFGLRPHLRLGTELVAAHRDDAWTLTFADGTTEVFDVLIAATGQLNRPHIPDLAGLESFDGPLFHSARWDHDADLTDRDVSVVGIGASAIQFVPEIAKVARSVTLYQRSVNFVAPKRDGEFSPFVHALLDKVPAVQRLYRAWIWASFEARWMWFRKDSRSAKLLQRKFGQALRPMISDQLPERAVVPDYPLGCKRILISNDWYPTLLRPNVSVVSDHVDEVTPDGIRAGGVVRPADAIIFGTGFEATGFLAPIEITDRDRRRLHDQWAGGAEAHLGVTVRGFDNLFLLYGPNTNLGHNSIVFMLERQMSLILSLVRGLCGAPGRAVGVRPEVHDASNRRLQAELDRTVWGAACHSWYKTASGKITNNWSGPTIRYWWRTAWPRRRDYTTTSAPTGDRPLVHSGRSGSPE